MKRSVRVALTGSACLMVAVTVGATPALAELFSTTGPPALDNAAPLAARGGMHIRLPPNDLGVAPADPGASAFAAEKQRLDAQYALTAAEVTRAGNLLRADQKFRSLTQAQALTVVDAQSWKGPHDTAARGALLRVTIPTRESAPTTSLPLVTQSGGDAYTVSAYQASFGQARTFEVLVGFDRSAVVQIMPLSDGTASFTAGPQNPARSASEGQ